MWPIARDVKPRHISGLRDLSVSLAYSRSPVLTTVHGRVRSRGIDRQRREGPSWSGGNPDQRPGPVDLATATATATVRALLFFRHNIT